MVPGVYVERRGPPVIESVPTSTTAMLGETERGVVKPRRVSNHAEFVREFGGSHGPRTFLPDAVKGFFENGGYQLYICRIVGKQSAPSTAAFGDVTVKAVGPGAWGRRVWVRVDEEGAAPRAGPDGTPRRARVRLRAAYWTEVPDGGVFDPFDPAHAERRTRCPPEVVEEFVFDAEPGSPASIDRCLVDADGFPTSALVTLVRNGGAAPDALPATGSMALAGGCDDPAAPDASDFGGEFAGLRTELQGLVALEADRYADVALVHAPAASASVASELIAHCEKMRYRFAVLDSGSGTADVRSLDPRATLRDTPYAAYYAPWIDVIDPQSGARRLVPPGGHVLGLYAHVDARRGVFKAPAGETLRGVAGLQVDLTEREHALLNRRGVNVIRRLREGIAVMGARTLSSDPRWTYVSVRRLLIFLERSIDQGTQWVLFEPNAAPLWREVRDSIRGFLQRVWLDGALLGSKPEEAFVVRCDETTMTPEDIAGGRLVCEVGVAPLKPAEFIVFRLIRLAGQAQD